MEMVYEEIERNLIRIFTGCELFLINSTPVNTYVLFKQPTNIIKMKADTIYTTSLNQALNDGLLSIKSMEKLLDTKKIYTSNDQQKVDGLRSKLQAQEFLLSKTTKVQANVDRIKGVISGLKQEIRTIESKKYSKLSMSAENKAEEDKALYLCWACTYEETEDILFWPTYEEMLNESNLLLRSNILSGFISFYNGLSVSAIRYIARSNLWRIRYITSLKTSESLFGISTAEYNNDMLSLAYWSNFYQNIYDMMPEDRPSDDLIEDDVALDAYMKNYYDERNREDHSRKSKHRTKGKLSAFDSEEVIVTQSNEFYQDIKYDKPKEAQRIKDRMDIKKRTRRPV